MTVLNPAAILFNNRWQSKFCPFVSRKALITARTTAAAANRIALIRYSGVQNLGIVVMTEWAAQ